MPNTTEPTRPIGLVIVVVGFVAFAVADIAVHIIQRSGWWIVSLSMSVLLVLLFRKLWFGDEHERKIAVFFSLFVAALNWVASSDDPLPRWLFEDYVGALEGVYALSAAAYLTYAQRDPFFSRRGVS
jgi:hypothetical protein